MFDKNKEQYIDALQWLKDNWSDIDSVTSLDWMGGSDIRQRPIKCLVIDIDAEIKIQSREERQYSYRRIMNSLEITFRDETTATIATLMFA
jgi:hypothetical protein